MQHLRIFLAVLLAVFLASCVSSPQDQGVARSEASHSFELRQDFWKNVQYLQLEPYVPDTATIPTFPPSSVRMADAFDLNTCQVRRQAVPIGLVSVTDVRFAEDACRRQQVWVKSSSTTRDVGSTISVYFGTDRKSEKNGETVGFGNSRGALSTGSMEIAIPSHHKFGQLERTNLRRQPERGFEILSLAVLDAKAFGARSRQVLAKKREKRAFIFVHGYNVSFADAALRTAQLSADLDPEALPVFYSWPAQGALLSYPVDSQNAEWTETNAVEFFELVASSSGADAIVIIAHSMGSRPATRALAKLLERRRDLRGKFRELVLAAPDIDAEVFIRDLAPAYAKLGLPITLYASASDSALKISRSFNGAQRAGDASPVPVTANGVEVVDASDIDTNFFSLGHSYAVESRVLLTDVTLLVKNRMRAEARPGLQWVNLGTAGFWRFRK